MVSSDKFNLLYSYIFRNKDDKHQISKIESMRYKSIFYICQNGTSGYANAAKGYIYDYISKKIPVKIQYFNCSDEVNENDRFHQYLKSQTNHNINYDTIIVHSTPDIWTTVIKNAPDINLENKIIIGRTVWEFEKLLPSWVDAINSSIVDYVSVPTEWNKECFIKNGVIKPIIVEPHIYVDFPFKQVGFKHLLSKSFLVCKSDKPKNIEKAFKFYCIGQFIERKGILETVETFCKAFNSNDDVLLIVKTFKLNYSEEEQKKCIDQIIKITNKFDHAPILYVKEQLNYDEIQSLHELSNCYFHLTKTEGFCLGAFDAFNKNKKVIITGFGGHTEYLGKNYQGFVNYTLTPLSNNESVFFQFKLDNSYEWAKPDFTDAIEKIRNEYLSFNKYIDIGSQKVLKLSTGWYDLENTAEGKFRWMSTCGEILVDSIHPYQYLILNSINLYNKKKISIFIKKRNFDKFECLFEKQYNINEQFSYNIPLNDVKVIQIRSDYFCPAEEKINEDNRKLSLGIFKFAFEKNGLFYTQSIDKIRHVDEVIYEKLIDNLDINELTNKFFNFKELNQKNIKISKKVKSGIILYLQNLENKNKKCLDNLLEYKHSKNDIPIIVYSDADIKLDNYPFKFISIPKIPKMQTGMYNASDKYAFWAFIESIKIAKELNLDYFFCYEWDCKIGKDYWYDTIWQEHLNWPGEPTMTGTPVFKCPLNGSGNLLQGIQDYRYQYSKESKLYMVVEHTYPYSLYTNGALTFYNTKDTEFYFHKEMHDEIKNKSDYMDIISPWDLEIGIRLFKNLKEKSFDKVGWLPSSYSGCGDYYYNQNQRDDMLNKGLKVVIHQNKYES